MQNTKNTTPKTKKKLSRRVLLICDIVCCAALLLTFCWFHHGRPEPYEPGEDIPKTRPDDSGTPDFKEKTATLHLASHSEGIGRTYTVDVIMTSGDDPKQGCVSVLYRDELLSYTEAEAHLDGGTVTVTPSDGADGQSALTVAFDTVTGHLPEDGRVVTLSFTVLSGTDGTDPVTLDRDSVSLTDTAGKAIRVIREGDEGLPTGDEDVVLTVDAGGSETGDRYTVKVTASTALTVTKGTFRLIYNNVRLSYFHGKALDGASGMTVTETDNGDKTSTLTVSFKDLADGSSFVFLFTANVPLEGLTPFSVTADAADLAVKETKTPTCGVVRAATVSVKGDFRDIFPGEFASSGTETDTDNEFKNENVHITWQKVHDTETWHKPIDYYVADIYIRTPDYMKTHVNVDKDGNIRSTSVRKMVQDVGAIVGINGDYFSYRFKKDDYGLVIRNGKLYRNTGAVRDTLFYYADGTMAVFSAQRTPFDIEGQEILDVWGFGPSLLRADGTAKKERDEFNSDVMPANPRSALGYYEPGHYCFICVDGRGKSEGLRMEELATLAEKIGCKIAYNMDGGDSSVLVWEDKTVNVSSNPNEDGRSNVDMICIVGE